MNSLGMSLTVPDHGWTLRQPWPTLLEHHQADRQGGETSQKLATTFLRPTLANGQSPGACYHTNGPEDWLVAVPRAIAMSPCCFG